MLCPMKQFPTLFLLSQPQTGWSELARMADFTDYPELIAQGALGELLTKGALTAGRSIRVQRKKQKALK